MILHSIHKTTLPTPGKRLPNQLQSRGGPRSKYAFILFSRCIAIIKHLPIKKKTQNTSWFNKKKNHKNNSYNNQNQMNFTCCRTSLIISDVAELETLWLSIFFPQKLKNFHIDSSK
jgi:hypothetical protein